MYIHGFEFMIETNKKQAKVVKTNTRRRFSDQSTGLNDNPTRELPMYTNPVQLRNWNKNLRIFFII
jgi:hypothetical protein